MSSHVEQLVPFYALGALTPNEMGMVEAHLAECAACRALAAEASGTAGQLAFAPDPMQPSAGLKKRLFERVRADAARRAPPNRLPGAFDRLDKVFSPGLGVVGLLLALIVGVWAVALQAKVARLATELQGQREALTLIAMPGARTIALAGTEFAPGAFGALVAEPDGPAGVLIVSGLPPLESGREYQLWLIRGDQPVGVGTFKVDANGMGQLRARAPSPISEFQTIGITDEPDGGSPAPTGQLVMSGALE